MRPKLASLTFLKVLTFALLVQKQRWVTCCHLSTDPGSGPRLSGWLTSPLRPPVPGSLKMVLDEAVKLFTVLQFNPPLCASNSLCGPMGGAHSPFLLGPQFSVCPELEHVGLSCEQSWRLASWNVVYWKEPWTGKLALGQALFSNTNK